MEKKKKIKKKENNQLSNLKKLVSSYKFLYTTFGILLGIVIILGIIIFILNIKNRNNTTMAFPIIEKGSHNSIKVDLSTLINKEYIVKIKNYRDNKVNQEKLYYSIILRNDSSAELEVTKDKEKKNLMTDYKQSEIAKDTLKSKKKEEVVYHIKIKDNDKVKKGEYLYIDVES